MKHVLTKLEGILVIILLIATRYSQVEHSLLVYLFDEILAFAHHRV